MLQQGVLLVDRHGVRCHVLEDGAFDFVKDFVQAVKLANWVRAVDPRHADHHVGEGHWMGSYRARLIDKLDPQTQEVVSFEHVLPGFTILSGRPSRARRR